MYYPSSYLERLRKNYEKPQSGFGRSFKPGILQVRRRRNYYTAGILNGGISRPTVIAQFANIS
jgi:hypothetical protein